jgi:hypothetical protein
MPEKKNDIFSVFISEKLSVLPCLYKGRKASHQKGKIFRSKFPEHCRVRTMEKRFITKTNTCRFEDKRFILEKTIIALTYPAGSAK